MGESNIAQGRWINAKDGKQLYWREWKADNPVACLLWIHGLGEHISRYDQHFQYLCSEHQISCYGFDQRGFGRTGKNHGLLGHAEGWKNVMGDITTAVEFVRQDVGASVQMTLGSQSLGGLRALHWVMEMKEMAEKELSGLIMNSPGIKAAPKAVPSPIAVSALKMVRWVLPTLAIPNAVPAELLSRDKEVVENYGSDPLVHPYVSLQTGKESLEKCDTLIHATPAIAAQFPENLKMLFMHGTVDEVTDPNATKDFVGKINSRGNVDLVMVEGGYHELYNEPENTDFVRKRWADFITGAS